MSKGLITLLWRVEWQLFMIIFGAFRAGVHFDRLLTTGDVSNALGFLMFALLSIVYLLLILIRMDYVLPNGESFRNT